MAAGNRNQVVDVGYMVGDEFFVWKDDLFADVNVKRGKEQMSASGQRLPQTVYHVTFDFWDVAGIDEQFSLRFEGNILNVGSIWPHYQKRNTTTIEAVAVTLSRTGGGEVGQGQPGDPEPPLGGGGGGGAEYD